MKTIITGPRDITDYNLVRDTIERAPFRQSITAVFCAMERGVDVLAYRWAFSQKLAIKEFKPDWNSCGKAAAFIRHSEMAAFADAAIILDDLKDPWVQHLLHYSKGLDPKLIIHREVFRRETLRDVLLGSVSSPGSSPVGPPSPPVASNPVLALAEGHRDFSPTASAVAATPPPIVLR